MAYFVADDISVSDCSQPRVPFTTVEELAVIEEYAKRQKLLEGKFTPSHAKADRRHAWADLAAAVNSVSNHGIRTVAQIKKRRQNITSAAKKKLAHLKRPGTDGGKRELLPTIAEEAVLVTLEGRPSLQGLDVAIDTGDSLNLEDVPLLIDASGNLVEVIPGMQFSITIILQWMFTVAKNPLSSHCPFITILYNNSSSHYAQNEIPSATNLAC